MVPSLSSKCPSFATNREQRAHDSYFLGKLERHDFSLPLATHRLWMPALLTVLLERARSGLYR
jgi:hypothetical protein